MRSRAGLFLIITLLSTAGASAQNTRNVLVLMAGSSNLPVNTIFTGVFRQAFGADERSEVFEEYFDEYRLSVDNETFAETLNKKYVGKNIDLVIGVGAAALNFLLQRKKLWPGTPEVFAMVDPRMLPKELPYNLTGVASDVDLGPTIDFALQLLPNTRQVFYVGGDSPLEKMIRSFAAENFARFRGRLDFTYLDHLPLPEILDRLGRLPKDSIVFYSMLYQDGAGQVYVPARVCSEIVSSSNAPVYGAYETYLGCGIVGGTMENFGDIAHQTASLGLRVLEQGTASGFPVERSSFQSVADLRQLQRWKISEDRLPAGTIVQFRPQSAWERYKRYVPAGTVAIVVLLGTMLILVKERQKRRTSDLAVKNLSGHLINAREEERRRIARELHDDISQRLSLVSLELSLKEQNSQGSGGSSRRPSRDPLEHLQDIITDVHNLSHQLHPGRVESLGLSVVLRDFCQQLSKQYNVVIDVVSDDIHPSPGPELALCFYRVAQEALHNAVKHSGSARIEVKLTRFNGVLRLTVKDYGSGFDPFSSEDGLGLATMRERLQLVDGTLLVESRRGKGTQVTAQAPLGTSMYRTA